MSGEPSSDIFWESPAWKRLNEPSPASSDPFMVRVKHDTTQVFQSVIAGMQRLHRGQSYDREMIDDLNERVDEQAKEHDALVKRLFDEKNGAFINIRAYVDTKVMKLYTAAWALACSIVTACITALIFRFIG